MSGIYKPASGKTAALRIAMWILTAACMVVIAVLSAQPAEKSAGLSGELIRRIAEFLFAPFRSLDSAAQDSIVGGLQFIARKSAHVLLYLALGLFSSAALFTYRLKRRAVILAALCISALYAVSDEIHQAFVPGRGPAVTDVLLDAAGAMLGILICMLIYRIARNIRRRGLGRTGS